MIGHSEVNPSEWLGKAIRDVLTDVEGLCSSVLLQSNGNIMLAIQTKADKNVAAEPKFVDLATVDIIGDGISDRVASINTDVGFAIGDNVKDLMSPMVGVVSAMQWYVNGCTQATITGPKLDDKGQIVNEFLLATRLVKTGTKASARKIPQTKTGGPTQPVRRAI